MYRRCAAKCTTLPEPAQSKLREAAANETHVPTQYEVVASSMLFQNHLLFQPSAALSAEAVSAQDDHFGPVEEAIEAR